MIVSVDCIFLAYQPWKGNDLGLS